MTSSPSSTTSSANGKTQIDTKGVDLDAMDGEVDAAARKTPVLHNDDTELARLLDVSWSRSSL